MTRDNCLSTTPRAFAPGSWVQQFDPSSGQTALSAAQGVAQVAAPQQVAPNAIGSEVARSAVAAANRGPIEPVLQQRLFNGLLGPRIALHEFDSNGYNAEGGGPVASGEALSCDFDSRPCCWANVPPPDDQLDWHLATGAPNSPQFQNAPIPNGKYLVAYASNSAPSDEAQFASCAIGCASSPIIVRARHWQSENVLLQVCQRESFPNTVNFNPLLNCQEFPMVNSLGATEVVLPKASLTDIVFVASNFVSEQGDMAILDDIEVIYESEGEECGLEQEDQKSQIEEKTTVAVNSIEDTKNSDFRNNDKDSVPETKLMTSVTLKKENLHGEIQPSKVASFAESDLLTESELESASGLSARSSSPNRVFASKTANTLPSLCNNVKCTFENQNMCNYKEAHQTESIRGVTTSFQVVTGQYMNRITGVKEGIEGNYYAATFLYPREIAGLAIDIADLKEPIRLRFRYYEGTHGVQLKGCCENLEHCLFASDKFVSVEDRMWKMSSFTCSAGTSKILFVCENTRTNQGSCAIDDIQMIENDVPDLRLAKKLC
ncbi:unnamed protein product [Thelazia callipaeda]|uniref:MAM domain-containing protein n=1 Tax=Thelazia callipaeda TaxID=103827 RepID=A0A0N5D0I4_THECL|nr:unnamed protein product [Thelazia callipaeda]